MPLSKPMQIAAVEVEVARGKTLSEIREEYPELKEGVNAIEAKIKTPPRRRGSGPMAPVTTPRPKF